MKWITRERPKIDRVACPWLVTRFIDKEAEFLFVPPSDVRKVAEQTGAIPYDIEGVELSHDGPLCSFDAFLAKYRLKDPSLLTLAKIVRGADTDRLDTAPQCAGLLAVSLGLSRLYTNDQEQLRHGFVIYDALYAWLREARDETHTWNPQRQAPTDDRNQVREERTS
ncbi:MAG TPA: chromate resistance protein ChrB domain-containing protein [Gemmatimonadaceae bacterium]